MSRDLNMHELIDGGHAVFFSPQHLDAIRLRQLEQARIHNPGFSDQADIDAMIDRAISKIKRK